MAKYRTISPKIWNDAKFRSLSDNGKLVFFMLLTHPHTSSIGTLRAYIQGLTAELGWTNKAFQEAFQEGLDKGLWKADEKAGLIWLPNFIKYNQPQSPNVLKSWVGALDDCPECSLKVQVFSSIKSLSGSLSKAFQEAFQEAFGKTLPNQDQDQDQDHDQEQILNTFSSEAKNRSEHEIELIPEEIFIELPLIGKDAVDHKVTKREIEQWQELYPAVDIEQELKKIKGYFMGSPQKRKTKSGINRSIHSWLAKAQDQSRQNAPKQPPKTFAELEEEREKQKKEDWMRKMAEKYGEGS